MSPNSPWTRTPVKNGRAQFDLSKWADFPALIYEVFLPYNQYVWRGHKFAKWTLMATLGRRKISGDDPDWQYKHQKSFQLHATRQRGAGPQRPASDNDVWALGQHYGLDTPLLDWTGSPFVAAYFAFLQPSTPLERRTYGNRRAVWGLSATSVQEKSASIMLEAKKRPRKPSPGVMEMIYPVAEDNARLISQGGLFSRTPDGVSVEQWVDAAFAGATKMKLVKIVLPDEDRHDCLKMLNRMNINHKSLFPDLTGVSVYCNLCLEIPGYANEFWPQHVPGWSKDELQAGSRHRRRKQLS